MLNKDLATIGARGNVFEVDSHSSGCRNMPAFGVYKVFTYVYALDFLIAWERRI